jgi:hypothetical protein
MKKVGDVLMTYDYDTFDHDEKNRPINENNLGRIIKSMEDNFLITVSLVIKKDGKLVIMDGQHRRMACKALKKPYFFTIVDDIEDYDLKSNNESLATLQNTKSWTPADFVHYYKHQGNEEYSKLYDFMEEMDLPCITSVICLTGKIGVGLPKKFKQGHFKVENINRAYHLAQIINGIKKVGYKTASNPRFTSALFVGLNKHDISIKKIMNGLDVNPNLRLMGGSVRDTHENLRSYSMKDKPINKRFVEFNNEWSY